MKKLMFIPVLIMLVLLFSCDLFVAPVKTITESTYKPKLDGYVGWGGGYIQIYDDLAIAVHNMDGGPDIGISLVVFDLDEIPSGSIILEAELNLMCVFVGIPSNIELYRIKKKWDKDELQWDDIDGNWIDQNTVIDFAVNAGDAGINFKLDLKEIIQVIVNGEDNYGFALVPSSIFSEDADIYFSSKEGDDPPELFVRYE